MKGDPWHGQAACGDDPEAMFPGSNAAKVREAKALCRGCPVREECLADAMKTEGNKGKLRRYGIRGGLTPTARRRLHDQTQRRTQAAA